MEMDVMDTKFLTIRLANVHADEIIKTVIDDIDVVLRHRGTAMPYDYRQDNITHMQHATDNLTKLIDKLTVERDLIQKTVDLHNAEFEAKSQIGW
jgi:hypothetical protein